MNHRRRILCVRPSIEILFAVFLPIQESWPFGCFFQNFGPVLSDFLYLDYKWCTLGNCQCRDVLLFWIIVGRTMLAVDASRVVSTILSHYFSLSISTETLSQRAVKSKSTTTPLPLPFFTI